MEKSFGKRSRDVYENSFFGDKKLSEIRFNGRTEKYCKWN